MHHHHRHHHHHHEGSVGSPFGELAAFPGSTLVNVTQMATAIAYGGGTAIAINITYIFIA